MNGIKRIAFLCHPYHRGGVTRWMADAAVAASEGGAEVWFVTVRPTRPFMSAGGRETMNDLLAPFASSIKLIRADAGTAFEFGTENYRAVVYADLVKRGVPAGTPVVVSDDMAVWAAAASVSDQYPMVAVLHGDQDYYADKAVRFEKQMSVAVCVSERVKKRLLNRCPGFDEGRIFVIPCGVTLRPTTAEPDRHANTRLLFVGRLTDYEKRAYDLVTICAGLQKEGVEYGLHIVGSSVEAEQEYGAKFREAGVVDKVSFHGWQPAEKVHEMMASGDVLILTSNSEGMPLVMMEALAVGCGFAGTRVSGIEDYEHHELAPQCIRVFAVGDTDAAVQQIKDLAKVPVPIRRAAARELAEQQFTMRVCLDRYAQALTVAAPRVGAAFSLNRSPAAKLSSRLRALARVLKAARLKK